MRKAEFEMFCTECGAQMPDGLAFCTVCGAPLLSEDAMKDEAAQEAQQATDNLYGAPAGSPYGNAAGVAGDSYSGAAGAAGDPYGNASGTTSGTYGSPVGDPYGNAAGTTSGTYGNAFGDPYGNMSTAQTPYMGGDPYSFGQAPAGAYESTDPMSTPIGMSPIDTQRGQYISAGIGGGTPKPRRSNTIPVVIGIGIAALVIIAVVVGVLVLGQPGSSSTSSAASTSQKTSTSTYTTTTSTSTSSSSSGSSNVSAKPSFPTAKASSVLPTDSDGTYYESNMLDNDTTTAWNSNSTSSGVTIKFSAASTQQVSAVRIMGGFCNNEQNYYENSRPKDITLSFDDGHTFTATLEDRPYAWQTITLSSPIQTKTVTLTINSAYAGSEWSDLAISEVQFT